MPTNPASAWGEVEIPLADIEGGNPLDANGVPLKAYRDEFTSWRGLYGGESHIRGETRVIAKRPPADRQTPPGYSGSGNVVVVLLPGYRYWKLNAGTGSEEEWTGRISCHPDEAVQLVALGSASYA